MSQIALEELQTAWPGRIALRADEVALVLRGKQTKGVTERIRNKIKDGSYGTGARQIDGVWQLPLRDLAEVIDPTTPALRLPDRNSQAAPVKSTRRRATIGPYLRFVRDAFFWADVLRALGMAQDADGLAAEGDAILREMREKAQVNRAQRSRDALIKGLNLDHTATPPKKRIF